MTDKNKPTLSTEEIRARVFSTNKFTREEIERYRAPISAARAEKGERRESVEAPASMDPLTTLAGRNWMAKRVLEHVEVPGNLLLLFGNGPFEAEELARFLAISGISSAVSEKTFETDQCNPDHDWVKARTGVRPLVVIGKEGFDPIGVISLLAPQFIAAIDLSDAISLDLDLTEMPFGLERVTVKEKVTVFHRTSTLKNMRFLSQEMFLAALFSGTDPDGEFDEIWNSHCQNHPGLRWVEERRASFANEAPFTWPTTKAAPGQGPLLSEWPKIGMLKCLGYTVGKEGARADRRRAILGQLFEMTVLPRVESPQYVREWGTPNSSKRLKKMADAIAALCRNAKRKASCDMAASIDDWENDLDWLEHNHYRGRFERAFPWPKTE